ncbi:MAG: hypothetical protein ABSG89_11210, partial [Bacteroidales bacterium]
KHEKDSFLVVSLLRRQVVNLDRRGVVSLVRRQVVNLTVFCSKSTGTLIQNSIITSILVSLGLI